MTFDDRNVSCAWTAARIDAFVDGDASDGFPPAEREAVERHVETCAACRARLGAAVRIAAELRALGTFDVPDAVIARAEEILDAENPTPVRVAARPRRINPGLSWVPAAVAAAAVAVMILTAHWSQPPRTEPAMDAQTAEVQRAARETALALSYVTRYARYTGRIVEDDVIEKRVIGTMERAIESSRDDVDDSVTPTIRRAMEKSGIIETKSGGRRS